LTLDRGDWFASTFAEFLAAARGARIQAPSAAKAKSTPLDWDPNTSGIRALESNRARHEHLF
jgi:hypothetical protein